MVTTTDIEIVAVAGAAVAIAGAVIYAIYELSNNQQGIQQTISSAAQLLGNNPISKAVETSYLQQQTATTAAGLSGTNNYNTAVVDYLTSGHTVTLQQLMQQSASNNNSPVLIVTSNSTGSYGGNISTTPITVTNGQGTYSNPWDYSTYIQHGAGWYVNVPGNNAATPIHIS